MSLFNTQVKSLRRFGITIPDNTGNGSTILSLLQAAGFTGDRVSAVMISGYQAGAGGTQRAAFVSANARVGTGTAIASSDFTTHGEYVAAGAPYYYPAEDDASLTYVRSATGSTVAAVATVLI